MGKERNVPWEEILRRRKEGETARALAEEFGVSVDAGLPYEMAFMRLNGAFATDNAEELTLTEKGRYLTLVMYRQFLSGMNNLRDQARAQLTGLEHELLFGDGTPA